MRRIYEAPKKTKAVRRLLSKAAKNESFCELVIAMRELMIEHCASAGHMRKALALAIHEQAWSNYKIQQGIQPEVIVALGATAAKYLLDTRLGINKLRGTWQSYRGIPLMPTYHTAYLLRAYTPQNRRRVWDDMLKVCAKLGLTPPAKR